MVKPNSTACCKFLITGITAAVMLVFTSTVFAEEQVTPEEPVTVDIDYQTYFNDITSIDLYNKDNHIIVDDLDTGELMFKADPCKEYVYTEVRLNLRDLPSIASDAICTLPENSKVVRVGTTDVGWSIIQIDEVNYFMWDEYLTKIAPDEFIEITSIESYIYKAPETSVMASTSYVPSYSNGSYLGTYKLTAYCNCSTCCGQWAGGATASGTYPTAGRTIASDLPFGTQVSINGHVYTVEDRGVGGNHIDIYFDSHAEALSFGLQYADVYLV